MKYIAFGKHNRIIEGVVLDNIINLAKLGFITKAGRKLLLVPDTRFGPPDACGMREFANGQTVGTGSKEKKLRKTRKKDCIPLLNLVPAHLRSNVTKAYSPAK